MDKDPSMGRSPPPIIGIVLVLQICALACFFVFGELADRATVDGGSLGGYRKWDDRSGLALWTLVAFYLLGNAISWRSRSRQKLLVALIAPALFAAVIAVRVILK